MNHTVTVGFCDWLYLSVRQLRIDNECEAVKNRENLQDDVCDVSL